MLISERNGAAKDHILRKVNANNSTKQKGPVKKKSVTKFITKIEGKNIC